MQPDVVTPRGIQRWIKHPFAGLSHGAGALLSIVALVVLVTGAAGRVWVSAAVAIYGASLILLYSASAAAHCIYCSPRTEKVLDQLDCAAIYVLIAGTYTPLCLATLRGPWGWTLLALEWGLAAIGIAAVWLLHDRVGKLRVFLYITMGWLAVAFIRPLMRGLPPAALVWLLAGGVIYSIGAVVFATDRPRLWPGRFGAHDLWHVMVLVASACHFIVVACYIVR